MPEMTQRICQQPPCVQSPSPPDARTCSPPFARRPDGPRAATSPLPLPCSWTSICRALEAQMPRCRAPEARTPIRVSRVPIAMSPSTVAPPTPGITLSCPHASIKGYRVWDTCHQTRLWTRVGRRHIRYVIFSIMTYRRPNLLITKPTMSFRGKKTQR